MASSRPDGFPPVVPDPNQSTQRSPDSFPYLIRAARQQDLIELTDLLSRGFHSPEGRMGWFYPLLKMGIQEDLRTRLRAKTPQYACLVAVTQPPIQSASPAFAKLFLQQAASANPQNSLLGSPIVGTVELGMRTGPFWSVSSKNYLYISNLAVRAEYRRQGIAHQLLLTCERIALDWGFRDLYLHVLENNQSARQLYQKLGYRYHQAEFNPLSCLMGRPRQLLLHKSLKGHPPYPKGG